MPFPPGLHQPGDRGALTAGLLELVIGHRVYHANFYPSLPRLIASVHDGKTASFASSLASLLGAAMDKNTGSNFAANAAIDCRDRPRSHDALPAGAGVFDRRPPMMSVMGGRNSGRRL